MFNGSGGIDWWITPHSGIRFEIRDQFLPFGSILLGARVVLEHDPAKGLLEYQILPMPRAVVGIPKAV